MSKVTFKKTGQLVRCWLDGEPLNFNSDGEVSRILETGEHALTWVVVGAPGSPYSVKITAPESAVFTHETNLDASRKDAGVHWITI